MRHSNGVRIVAVCLVGVALLVGLAGVGAAQEAPDADGPPDVTIEVGDEEFSSVDEDEEEEEEKGNGDNGQGPPEEPGPPGDDEGEDEEFLSVENGVLVEGYGGEMHVDCTGDWLEGHVCDKGGYMTLEEFGLYYDGVMGGPIAEWEYWFDDDFDLYVAGEEGTVEFDCYEMSWDHLHCAVDGEHHDDADDGNGDGADDRGDGNGNGADDEEDGDELPLATGLLVR